MKYYLALGSVIAVLLYLLWPHRTDLSGTQNIPDRPSEIMVQSNPSRPVREVMNVAPDGAGSNPASPDKKDLIEGGTTPETAAAFDEAQNIPLGFYGLIVDQDTNPLPSVIVDLEVTQIHLDPSSEVSGKTTVFQRQTGADGRFEISGLRGHSVTVRAFTRDGYEPELIRREYGTYGAQGTSADNPAIFKMWRTNIHEQLITGDKKFEISPDGRHYGMDFINGTLAEGEEGDLVVWIKRPESVVPPQKYSWSCGMAAPGGGLEPDNDYPSYRAPLGDYTNVFDFHVEYNTPAKRGMSLDNRYYVKLRNRGVYGRVSVDFWTTDRQNPASGLIRIVYAINPSGSRLLR
jgi:hypothetical protein